MNEKNMKCQRCGREQMMTPFGWGLPCRFSPVIDEYLREEQKRVERENRILTRENVEKKINPAGLFREINRRFGKISGLRIEVNEEFPQQFFFGSAARKRIWISLSSGNLAHGLGEVGRNVRGVASLFDEDIPYLAIEDDVYGKEYIGVFDRFGEKREVSRSRLSSVQKSERCLEIEQKRAAV